MPENEHFKLYVPGPAEDFGDVAASPSPAIRYFELHCKTNFTFLEGASHPDELVTQAATLGYSGLAVTDRNSLAGVVRAHVAAKKVGLKLIIGAEITLEDANPILVWAMDRFGYGQLCRLLTRGRRQAAKGECRLRFRGRGRARERAIERGFIAEDAGLEQDLSRWREVFVDRDLRRRRAASRSVRRAPTGRVATRGTCRGRAAHCRGGRSLSCCKPAVSPRRFDGDSAEDDRRGIGRTPLSERRAETSCARRSDPLVRDVPVGAFSNGGGGGSLHIFAG